MPKALRHIGYWDGPWAPEGLPDVCAFVRADADADHARQRQVAAYLRSGTIYVAAAGFSICRLCGRANGSTQLTDGEHFTWPEGLAHYVEEHGVYLPDEIAEVAAYAVAPRFDPAWFSDALLVTGEVTIDYGWWCGFTARTTVQHLRGCRRSELVASWDLPTSADIYIDRVPTDGLTVLAALRRLLGTSWPFSELRDLLARQPLRAATGNPRALYGSLSASPELRPYLFYGSEDALHPVWV